MKRFVLVLALIFALPAQAMATSRAEQQQDDQNQQQDLGSTKVHPHLQRLVGDSLF